MLQSAAQTQLGTGSTQVQVAIQSASTSQRASAVAVAISAKGVNSAAGWGATKQSVTSRAAADGHAVASVRQLLEQAQQGDRADQQQLAGQWTTIAQDQRLVAATGVSSAVNETSAPRRRRRPAHVRRHDEPRFVERIRRPGGRPGAGRRRRRAAPGVVPGRRRRPGRRGARGSDRRRDARYVTPPASALYAEPLLASAPTGSLSVLSVGSSGPSSVSSPVSGGPIKPRTALPRRARHVVASATHSSPRRAAHYQQVSATRAGSTGTAMKRPRVSGGASSGSPRRRGTAPQSIGAFAFGPSGTGTGGAHGALSRYVLLWAPGRAEPYPRRRVGGRRLSLRQKAPRLAPLRSCQPTQGARASRGGCSDDTSKGVKTLLRKFLIAGTGAVALAFPASALADVPDPGALQANIAAQVNVQVAAVKQSGIAASSASADAKARGGSGGSADGGISAGGAANSGAVGGSAGPVQRRCLESDGERERWKLERQRKRRHELRRQHGRQLVVLLVGQRRKRQRRQRRQRRSRFVRSCMHELQRLC